MTCLSAGDNVVIQNLVTKPLLSRLKVLTAGTLDTLAKLSRLA